MVAPINHAVRMVSERSCIWKPPVMPTHIFREEFLGLDTMQGFLARNQTRHYFWPLAFRAMRVGFKFQPCERAQLEAFQSLEASHRKEIISAASKYALGIFSATAADAKNLSAQRDKTVDKINEVFLTTVFEKGFGDSIPRSLREAYMRGYGVEDIDSWDLESYSLKDILENKGPSPDSLIEILEKRGPLVAQGYFGQIRLIADEPEPFLGHPLYEWNGSRLQTSLGPSQIASGSSQIIIVYGIDKKGRVIYRNLKDMLNAARDEDIPFYRFPLWMGFQGICKISVGKLF